MGLKGRDLISINDFTNDEITGVLKTSKEMEKYVHNGTDILKGKVLATLFFEPSTRTRLSFISAMEQFGGTVIGFSTASVTSIQKGESLWDTIKMVQGRLCCPAQEEC